MSSKNILIIILIIVIVGIGYWVIQKKEKTAVTTGTGTTAFNHKNCAYAIENKNITLKDGYSEEEVAPGSASKTITNYFGNEAVEDFNGDGRKDVAFILTQSGGGSGAFYYVVAALNTTTGCAGTNAIFLGDRIAPQTTEFQNGEIIVNYAERKSNEPMATEPSIGVSRYFKISNTSLVEI